MATLEAAGHFLLYESDLQKNGSKFEASVRKREKDNPLFGFLHPGNQHHALYRSAM